MYAKNVPVTRQYVQQLVFAAKGKHGIFELLVLCMSRVYTPHQEPVMRKWIPYLWPSQVDVGPTLWVLFQLRNILSIPFTTGRGTSAETCGLGDVFPPDDLGSRPEALC